MIDFMIEAIYLQNCEHIYQFSLGNDFYKLFDISAFCLVYLNNFILAILAGLFLSLTLTRDFSILFSRICSPLWTMAVSFATKSAFCLCRFSSVLICLKV